MSHVRGFRRLQGVRAVAVAIVLLAPLARAQGIADRRSTPAPTGASGACSDDAFEPNNVCASAAVVSAGTYPGLMLQDVSQDWYKVTVQRAATLTVTLTFTHANGDIDMKLFNSCGGSQLRISQGTSNTETFNYQNTGLTQDFYIQVYFASGVCNAYTMAIGLSGADNLVAADIMGGWSGPIVPRNDATAGYFAATTSSTLPGNSAGTWLNWTVDLVGPLNSPAWSSDLFIDDVVAYTPIVPDNSPPLYWASLNQGPQTIRGGRHTLTSVADIEGAMLETNEADNSYARQFIWSPLGLAPATPVQRPVPPVKGTGLQPNGDGFSFLRSAGYAWVVSEAALATLDDDDLVVYDNYSSSTSGFSFTIGSSALGGNATDFVVGHYSGTPSTVYPSVTRYLTAGGGGDFVADQGDAHAHNGSLVANPSFSWKPITLGANRLVDVYEANMTAGLTYYFSLRELSGTTPLSFEVFPGSPGGIYARTGGAGSVTTGTLQTLAYVPASTGWHPIVVYRRTGSNVATTSTYDFEWSTTGLVDVPRDDGATLAFAGAQPNPMRDHARFAFTLPRTLNVRLGIFDVHGRRVRPLVDGSLPAGAHAIEWDGRHADGTRVGAGVYWARLETLEGTRVQRVAVLP